MRVKSRFGWVIGLACIAAVACGDDDDASSGGGTSGDGGTSSAGHAGSSPVSGSSTQSGSSGNTGSGGADAGSAGDAGMGTLGGESTQGGAAGAQATEGGMGGEATDGGRGGVSTAGGASNDAGQAGGGGAPDANVAGHGVCPATLETTFKAGPYACNGCNPDDRVAWAAAFGCDVSQELSFTVKRFQVDATRIDEMYRPYQGTYTGKYFRFAIAPDCQPSGLEPVGYTQYPNTLKQTLEPGIYTEIICAADNQVVHSHYPPPMSSDTNVDCAHATPLVDGGSVPGGDLVGGGTRYFSFTMGDPHESVDLTVETSQTNEYGSISLTGPKDASSGEPRPLLPLPFTFPSLPAGDYCAAVNVTGDTSFRLAMDLK